MKKVVLSVSLLILSGVLFSFNIGEEPNGDEPNCILIQLYKVENGKKTNIVYNTYETIYAPNATEASNIAKKKYPDAYAVWIQQAGHACK
jgi:hypothetical protein